MHHYELGSEMNQNEYMTGGSKKLITPTVYIGIGGTGLETLKALKNMNRRMYGIDLPVLKYLSIDTRDNTEKLAPLDTTEMLDITTSNDVKNADQIIQNLEQKYPHILDWMPDMKDWTKFKNIKKITQGADQCRALGRFLFNIVADTIIQSDIDAALRTVTGDEVRGMIGATNEFAVHPSKGPEVFIICSVCGGTGSGMFLDLAYLCRHVGRAHGAMKIYGVLGLPLLFPTTDVELKKINAANGYAALKEMDHYFKNMQYKMRYSTLVVEMNGVAPFDQCFLLDSPNEAGMGFDVKDPGKSFANATGMIANGVFCLSTSLLEATYAEYLTNIISRQSQPEKNNAGTEYPSSYSSFGVAALEYPYSRIAAYCSSRLAKDIINKILVDRSKLDGSSKIYKAVQDFISRFELSSERLQTKLSDRVDTFFNNWRSNALLATIGGDQNSNKLAVKESILISAIKSEKAILDTKLNAAKQGVTVNMEKILAEYSEEGSEIGKFHSFFRKTANNNDEKGLEFAATHLRRDKLMESMG